MAVHRMHKFFVGPGGLTGVLLRSVKGIEGESSVTVMRATWTPEPPRVHKPLEAVLLSDWRNKGPLGATSAQWLASYLHLQCGFERITAYANTPDQQRFYQEHFGLIKWLTKGDSTLLASPELLEALFEKAISVEVKSKSS